MNDDRYSPTVTAPPVLSYDPAIYWIDDAWYVEQHLSIEVADDPRLLAYAQDAQDRAIKRRAIELHWGQWCEDEQRVVEGGTLRIRRTLYECPPYREVRRYHGPPTMRTLRLPAPGHTMIELPLRRLMDHGRPSLGALHEETLYIVEIVAPA